MSIFLFVSRCGSDPTELAAYGHEFFPPAYVLKNGYMPDGESVGGWPMDALDPSRDYEEPILGVCLTVHSALFSSASETASATAAVPCTTINGWL
ncbi:hypothetical protein [Streptomyces lavenduligriseus]|uniref:Uncharacterized protein n=1 Tax=Streptomyces lavenduligriseus TaxID=67315 RepID=A0ABT0P5J2_9ACTN|nr:hypothetical protein [Streptomyces lavenduligriseus]MCL3999000.1 hypothetical protein [Streptomyces lavenduligriseus]